MEDSLTTGGSPSPDQPPGSPNFFNKKAVRWTAFLLLLYSIVLSCWVAIYAFQSGPQRSGESAIVEIPPGTGIRHIQEILARNKLIHDDVRFLVLAKILGLSQKLPAGEFRLLMGQRPGDLLRQLATAKPVQYAVTIPEGLRIEEIADIFATGAWCDRDSFIALTHDPAFIQSLGFTSIPSLEGYLYPDTYNLTKEYRYDTKALITMQVNRFLSVWASVPPISGEQTSRHEVITLASVVEKETGDATERPLIAAVFLNRLKNGMRLQSDPTVIYGLEGFSGNLTKNDLKANHPYNTYVIPALPLGPICNPGRQAIEAVLHPTATDYFYFVSKNNGSHQFSKNLSEHNQAVREHQQGKKGAAK